MKLPVTAKNAINESGEVQSLIGQAYKGIDSNIGILESLCPWRKKISALLSTGKGSFSALPKATG